MKEKIISFIENLETKEYFGFKNGILYILRNNSSKDGFGELILKIRYNDEVKFSKISSISFRSLTNEQIAFMLDNLIKALNA